MIEKPLPDSRRSMTSAAASTGRALVVASFLSQLGYIFVFPLLPLYMKELAGADDSVALWSGLAMAATPLAGAVASPFWGMLADRYGYRPMLLRALASSSILIGMMCLPNAPWQLVVLRALAGAFGSFAPAAMGAMSSWSRPEDLSKAISRLQMAQVFGSIVGPLLGGGVAALFGIRYAPIAGGVTVALGVILVARWFVEPPTRHYRVTTKERPLGLSLLWLPMVTMIAFPFVDSSFNPILPLLLTESEPDAGRAASLAGLAISFSAAAGAIGSGVAGNVFKRRVGYRKMMVVAVVTGVLALLGLVAPLPWPLILIRVLCGGLATVASVASYSLVGIVVPPAQRGSAYGWVAGSASIGYAMSPLVAGTMAAIDLRAIMVLDVLLCIISATGWGIARATEKPIISPKLNETK